MDVQIYNGINVHNEFEAAVVLFLTSVTGDICSLNERIIYDNFKVLDSMPVGHRKLRLELGNYLINNFAFIYLGLVVNEDFRRTFFEAISIEVAIDDKSDDFVKDIRAQMGGDIPLPQGYYVLDSFNYSDAFFDEFCERISGWMDLLVDFGLAIDSFVSELSAEDRAMISFCFSNFAYAYRAFVYNLNFVKYIKSVIETIKIELQFEY